MEIENNTTGVGISEKDAFIPVKSNDKRNLPTISREKDDMRTFDTGDKLGVKYWAKFFQMMEDRFAFTGSLVGLVGYIIISAYGQMKSNGEYLRYVLFLTIIFLLYGKLSQSDKIKLEISAKINKFFVFGFLLLAVVFFFEHYERIFSILKDILDKIKVTL